MSRIATHDDAYDPHSSFIKTPRGGSDATDTELARAIVYMANQSGANLKEPASKPAVGKSK